MLGCLATAYHEVFLEAGGLPHCVTEQFLLLRPLRLQGRPGRVKVVNILLDLWLVWLSNEVKELFSSLSDLVQVSLGPL